MKAQILYTTALNNDGKLVNIDDAEKGHNYSCPICKQKLILRKSGKSGKGSRRPHFAHNELTSNCTPESALHFSFKRLLAENLNYKISKGEPFDISWICHYCGQNNHGNLLEKAKCLKEEYILDQCRTDIAVLGSDDNVIAAIEIVVTHLPENSTLEYYKEKGIPFVRIDLQSDEDLKDIEKKAKSPSWVEYCEKANCTIYNDIKKPRKIIVKIFNCGRCFAERERYFIELSGIWGKKYVEDFFDDEIESVKARNSNVKVEQDETTKAKWPVSVCRNCQIIRSKAQKRRY